MLSRQLSILALLIALPCFAAAEPVSDAPLLEPFLDNPHWNAGNMPELLTYDMKIVLRQGQGVKEIRDAFARLGNKIREPIGFYAVDLRNNPQEWGRIQRELDCPGGTNQSEATLLISSARLRKCHVLNVASSTELVDLIGLVVSKFDNPCSLNRELEKERLSKVVQDAARTLFPQEKLGSLITILVNFALDLGGNNLCAKTPQAFKPFQVAPSDIRDTPRFPESRRSLFGPLPA